MYNFMVGKVNTVCRVALEKGTSDLDPKGFESPTRTNGFLYSKSVVPIRINTLTQYGEKHFEETRG